MLFRSKIAFWDQQQKGANYFNENPTREWFESAALSNIKFVRLTYEKWEGEERDFLIGDADKYKQIVEFDFQKLFYDLNETPRSKLTMYLNGIHNFQCASRCGE